jgi:ABC-type transport system involved in multi-copper enzyme maturation permease subunit
MKAYALIVETFSRKASMRLVHLSWLGIYAAIFLIPMPPETWHWGPFLFGWSGCLLPLLLSEGIFGDDMASGRIRLLVTEPIRPWELYLYRFLGLSLQAAVHFAAVGVLVGLLHALTGRGSVDHWAAWVLASWLLFNTWAALSTSLSVMVRRAHNSMLLFVATVAVFFLVSMFTSFFPRSIGARVLLGAVRYACPPVELLGSMAVGKFGSWLGLGTVALSLTLTVLYGAAGVVLLSRREFKYVAD